MADGVALKHRVQVLVSILYRDTFASNKYHFYTIQSHEIPLELFLNITCTHEILHLTGIC